MGETILLVDFLARLKIALEARGATVHVKRGVLIIDALPVRAVEEIAAASGVRVVARWPAGDAARGDHSAAHTLPNRAEGGEQ